MPGKYLMQVHLVFPSSNCLVPVVTISDQLCLKTRYTPEEVAALRGTKLSLTRQDAKRFDRIYAEYEQGVGKRCLTAKEAVKLALRKCFCTTKL